MEREASSVAGKEVLIKAVAQFNIDIGIWSGYCQVLAGTKNKEESSLVKWSRLCLPKTKGGLGFRDFHSSNLAMLAKQGRRLLQSPNLLLCRILSAKYFPNCSLADANPKDRMSYTWGSLLEGKRILDAGCRSRGGDGSCIRIWGDKWLQEQHGFQVWSAPQTLAKVQSLIHVNGSWNDTLIEQFFLPFEAAQIKQNSDRYKRHCRSTGMALYFFHC